MHFRMQQFLNEQTPTTSTAQKITDKFASSSNKYL